MINGNQQSPQSGSRAITFQECKIMLLPSLLSVSACLAGHRRVSAYCFGELVVEQSSSIASPREYRRGLQSENGQEQWQKLWHFNEACETYPTRNFATRKDRPADEYLCKRCAKPGH